MEMEHSELLKEAVLEAINNQMESNDPPETKQTYDRLMKRFNDHDEVMKYIGCVLCGEVFDIMKKEESFNRQRYITRLKALPDLSWMS